MSDSILTSERILEAAEDVLRRYGPAKANVVDVANALGVSHGSVYRHFASKVALREAVAERWLERVSTPLETIVAEEGSAVARLRRWLDALITTKRTLAREEPELFATYVALANESGAVIRVHVAHLTDHLTRIVQDGIAQGEFFVTDPHQAGRAILDATARFHNPIHLAEWSDPAIDAAYEGVWQLLLRGLQSPPV